MAGITKIWLSGGLQLFLEQLGNSATESDRDQGAQVDLLIDRRDRVVNLCEIKFTNDPFTVSAKYAKELRNKEAVFKNKTGTKKAIFITLISAQGLEQNSHSVGLVSNTVTADALFS